MVILQYCSVNNNCHNNYGIRIIDYNYDYPTSLPTPMLTEINTESNTCPSTIYTTYHISVGVCTCFFISQLIFPDKY